MAKSQVRCHYCVMGGSPCDDCVNRQKQLDKQAEVEAQKPKPKPARQPFPETKLHCGTCGESYLPDESCSCTTRGGDE